MKDGNELFELCKQVYEATGWKQSPNISQLYEYWDDYDELCVISIEDADDTLVPAYTSDYLLEKLPEWIGKYGGMRMSRGYMKGGTGAFRFFYCRDCQGALIEGTGTTAVSALLKLTLKLHKEKML